MGEGVWNRDEEERLEAQSGRCGVWKERARKGKDRGVSIWGRGIGKGNSKGGVDCGVWNRNDQERIGALSEW